MSVLRQSIATGTRTAKSVGVVAIGSMIANACAYFVHLPASRWLSPDQYGEFAVLLQVTLVLGVPALALQAVVAREVVAGRSMASLMRLTLITAVVVAVISAGAVVPFSLITHTGLLATAAAATVAPLLVVISAGQGVLQGVGEFSLLARVLALVGIVRTMPPLVVLALGGQAAAALVATMCGAFVATSAVGVLVHRKSSRHHSDGGALDSSLTVVAATQVQLMLVLATSVDLLLSRVVLSDTNAGIYALGAVATKVAYWLPQAIGVVVYPALADSQRSVATLRRAILVLIGLATVVAAAAAIAGPLVPVIIGDDYRPVADLLWLFAITGGALAIMQVALLAAIARQHTRVAIVGWIVITVEAVVIATQAHSVVSLAACAAIGATVAAGATILVASILTRNQHEKIVVPTADA